MNSNKERAASHQIALHGLGENDKTSSIHFYKNKRDLTQNYLNKPSYNTIEKDSELFVIEAPNGCIPSPFSSFFCIFTTIYAYFKPKGYEWHSIWNPFSLCLGFSASKKKICKHINELIGKSKDAPIFLHGYSQGGSMCIESLKWLPKNAVVEELHLIHAYYLKNPLHAGCSLIPLTRSFIYWWTGATRNIDFTHRYPDMKIYYTATPDDALVLLSQGQQMMAHLIHMGANPSNIFIRLLSTNQANVAFVYNNIDSPVHIAHNYIKPFDSSEFTCWDQIGGPLSDLESATITAFQDTKPIDRTDSETIHSDLFHRQFKNSLPKIDDSIDFQFSYISLLIEIVAYLLVIVGLFFLTQMLFFRVCALFQCLKCGVSSVL
jgi:hypothetical protein